MKTRLYTPITWVLLLIMLCEGFVPLFAQTDAQYQMLFEKYRAAYMDYTGAVNGGASQDVINQRLEAYRQAADAYNRSMAPIKGNTTSSQGASQAQPQTSAGSEGVSAPTMSSSSSAATTTPVAALEKPATGIKSWFAKVYQNFRKAFVGQNGKEMPLWEKLAWNIGKALVPAFGVMVVTALLAPLAPVAMIIGGIAAGATLGGLMTYAYEKRMNAKYRETPKEDAKIWRDVTVAATVEAVMAPFNLATGGLFGIVGPTVGSAIYRVAATQAAISFAGAGLSSVAGGMVKHAWAKYYFHYPEKIKANDQLIDKILDEHVASGQPLSEAELKELDRLRAENEQMKGEDYSPKDFQKDMKRAALTAAISGFAGSVVADRFYSKATGKWADKLSVKVFGSAAQGKQLSSLVSTLPVNFVGGTAQATLEKSFINQDILDLRKEQAGFAVGSPGYQYYDQAIREKEARRDGIKVLEAGLDSAVNNLAVRSAQLGVQALKYNLYDGPKARRQAVDELYRQQNDEWKKASSLYEDYRDLMGKAPKITDYRNPVTYAKAQATYLKNLESARREWLNQCGVAKGIEERPDQVALRKDIEVKYDKDVKLNQMLELGRLNGGTAHLNAMKEILKARNPEYANIPDNDLTRLACQAIRQSYVDKHQSSTDVLTKLDETLQKSADYKAGKVTLTDAEAKSLTGQAALISPSKYKAALVEKQVYDWKAQGVTWKDVQSRMPEALMAAERQTMQRYGGNWATVLTAEMYANGLAKYKYDPDGGVSLKDELGKLAGKVPGMIEQGVVTDYTNRVNSAILSSVLPTDAKQENAYEKYMQSFAKSALTEGGNSLMQGVYSSSKSSILGAFGR